jgi:hypothetical protein
VKFVALTECLISRRYSLELGGVNALGLHYNLVGSGRAIVDDVPHTTDGAHVGHDSTEIAVSA